MARNWDGAYQANAIPWDTGVVAPLLQQLVHAGTVRPGRALEIGCGTGTNALWLAEVGFDVVALDLSPTAVQLATDKAASRTVSARFLVRDFLGESTDEGPFDFVFDRGVFHTFDMAAERWAFASRVAEVLAPDGVWYSLIGSTEGPAREHGPPRRSARQIIDAIEPSLEIVSLHAADFPHHAAAAWACLSRQRRVPAQPPTGS